MDTQFFTLDMLKTLAGIVAAVILVVQFSKNPVDWIYSKICKLFGIEVDKFPTQILTVIVSEILLFMVMFFTNQLDLLSIFLTSINGLVISGAAMKSFESITK
jgi:hypothetical protein